MVTAAAKLLVSLIKAAVKRGQGAARVSQHRLKKAASSRDLGHAEIGPKPKPVEPEPKLVGVKPEEHVKVEPADAPMLPTAPADSAAQLVAFWNFETCEAELAIDGKTYKTKDVAPAVKGDEGSSL
jgi:hypothetical protein